MGLLYPGSCRDGKDWKRLESRVSTWVIKCPHVSHHPTIRYMVYNGYYKVMSNSPKSWDIYQSLNKKHLSPKKKDQSFRQHMVSKQTKNQWLSRILRGRYVMKRCEPPNSQHPPKLGGCLPSFDSGWCREVS